MLIIVNFLFLCGFVTGQIPPTPANNVPVPPFQPPSPGGRPFVPSRPRVPRQPTIADKISQDPSLSEMVEFLKRVDLLKSLNATSFVSTVFVPNNDAIRLANIPTNGLELLKFVEYHYVAGNITTSKMLPNGHKWTLNGTYFNGSSVWFQVKQRPTGVTHYWINGAQVIAPDNIASNGVYHVIDRVLQPSGSLKSLSNYIKTATGYRNMASLLRDQRSMTLDRQLSNESMVWTLFAPTDTAVPLNRLQEKDPLKVLSRHLIRGRVLFDSCLSEMTVVRAVQGDIHLITEGDKVFVKNGAGEKAEIVEFNQPTENGVIHRISDVLGCPWRTVLETVQNRETLRKLLQHISSSGLDEELNRRDANFTLFAPTNEAFTSFMRQKKFTRSQVIRLIRSHIVSQSVTSMNVSYGVNDVRVPNLAKDEIRISKLNDQTEMMVHYRNDRAKVVVGDIRTANGVIHIIDRVLDGATSNGVQLTPLSFLTVLIVGLVSI